MNKSFDQYPSLSVPFLLKMLRKFDFPHKKGILRRLFGAGLYAQGIGWADTWNGTEWLIDGRSFSDQWMVFDRYSNSDFLKWAEKNVPPGGTIIDSGSNIGQFIPYFSKLVPQGLVIGFEPSSDLYAWILACLERSKLPNVEMLKKGLGEADSKMGLSLVNCEFEHGIWNSIVEEGGDELVEITTVSGEMSKRGVGEVALWKLDVEGFEIPAIRGAADMLNEKRIAAAYIELADDHDKENPGKIVDLMKSFNYLPYLFYKSGLKKMSKVEKWHKIDALFIPAGG